MTNVHPMVFGNQGMRTLGVWGINNGGLLQFGALRMVDSRPLGL